MAAVVIDHEDIPIDANGVSGATIVPVALSVGLPPSKDASKNVNRPDNSKWSQQQLPMWQPMLTLSLSIAICAFLAATCTALGVSIIVQSNALSTYRVVYDDGEAGTIAKPLDSVAEQLGGVISDVANCRLDTPDLANSFHANHTCYITITLNRTIAKKTYVFYELEQYFQHHRRFVLSMDRTQFTDEWRPGVELTTCAPMETMDSIACDIGTCEDEASHKTRELFPCGIVANTMFNDIFWLHDGVLPNGDRLGPTDLVSKGVARTYSHRTANPTWSMSLDDYLPVWRNPNFSRIIPPPSGDQMPHLTDDYTNSTAWVHDPLDPVVGVGTGLENEHWRVWVDAAAMQPFRKTYGVIARDLPAGTTLVFAVQSNFFVRSFSGRKALVVGELSWFGSENMALGVFFCGVAAVNLAFALWFLVRRCRNPRALGDASALEWKRKKRQ